MTFYNYILIVYLPSDNGFLDSRAISHHPIQPSPASNLLLDFTPSDTKLYTVHGQETRD